MFFQNEKKVSIGRQEYWQKLPISNSLMYYFVFTVVCTYPLQKSTESKGWRHRKRWLDLKVVNIHWNIKKKLCCVYLWWRVHVCMRNFIGFTEWIIFWKWFIRRGTTLFFWLQEILELIIGALHLISLSSSWAH